MAENIGKLNVSLVADTGGFRKGMDRASTKADKTTRSIKNRFASLRASANTNLKGIGVATTAAVAGLTALARKSITAQAAVGDLAEQIGTSTKSLTRYQFAARQAGSSGAKLSQGLQVLQKRLGQAVQKGTGPAADAFDDLGLSLEEVAKKDPTEQFDAIRRELVKLEDPTKANAIASQLFSRANQDLVGVLTSTNEEIQEYKDRSDALGNTITDTQAKIAQTADVALANLGKAFTGLTNKIVAGVAPALTGISNILSDTFVKSVNKSNDATKGFGKQLGTNIGFAIDALRSFYSVAKLVFETVGSIIGSFVAANVVAFRRYIQTVTDAGKALKLAFSGEFTEAGKLLTRSFKSSGEQIKSIFDGVTRDIGESFDENITNFNATKYRDAVAKAYEEGAKQASDKVKASRNNVTLPTPNVPEVGPTQTQDSSASTGPSEEQKRRNKLMRQGARITEQVRTATEVYNDRLDTLDKLLSTGNISQQTYTRAAKEARKALKSVNDQAGDTGEKMSEFAKQASRNIQDSFSKFLVDPLSGDFESLGDNFVKQIRRMAAEAASQDILEKLFGKGKNGKSGLESAISSIFSSGSSSGGKSSSGNGLVSLIGSFFGGFFADGGRPPVGRPSVVGERGPELFVPDSAGTIVPASKAGGGEGNVTVNVNQIGGEGGRVTGTRSRRGPDGERVVDVDFEVSRGEQAKRAGDAVGRR